MRNGNDQDGQLKVLYAIHTGRTVLRSARMKL